MSRFLVLFYFAFNNLEFKVAVAVKKRFVRNIEFILPVCFCADSRAADIFSRGSVECTLILVKGNRNTVGAKTKLICGVIPDFLKGNLEFTRSGVKLLFAFSENRHGNHGKYHAEREQQA